MPKNNNQKKEASQTSEIIKTGMVLFAITAVAALALAVINTITAPIIQVNNIEKTNVSMKNVMQTAEKFEKIELSEDTDKIITEIYNAVDSDGNTVGACVCVSPNGYGGAIDMVVGVGNDGKVTGVDIINQSETAGLGSKSTEPEFKDQYIGKGTITKVVKAGAKEDEINAISSATITSKAVTTGVNTAVAVAEELLSKEDK